MIYLNNFTMAEHELEPLKKQNSNDEKKEKVGAYFTYIHPKNASSIFSPAFLEYVEVAFGLKKSKLDTFFLFYKIKK